MKKTFFVNNEKQVEKFLLKPTFKCHQTFHNGLVSVSFIPSKKIWSKPIRAEASIFDSSIPSLYKFDKNEMEPTFDDKMKARYKEANSLLSGVKTENLNSEMATLKRFLALSGYPEKTFLYDEMNKKVTVTMRDGSEAKVLRETVCLRSNFSIQCEGRVKKCKRCATFVKKP